MENNFRNKLGFFTFMFIVLTLLVGGYFFTDYILNKEEVKKEEEKTNIEDNKIDKDKEYIYYENESTISEEVEIFYQDVVINLKNQEELTNTLKKENNIYKNNIKYLSDQDLIDAIINHNYDNLYALTFRKYQSYEYDKYLSLLITDYNYSCFDYVTFNKTKSYIFDKEKDILINEEEILNKYSLNMELVKQKVRLYLEENQSIVDDVELIKIDETLNEFNNYAFYVNEYGNLYISYLVKSNKEDYNEVMEVN